MNDRHEPVEGGLLVLEAGLACAALGLALLAALVLTPPCLVWWLWLRGKWNALA